MEIRGKIKEISELQVANANFSYKVLILDTTWKRGEQTMINSAKLQFINEKAELLEGFKVGDEVKVRFNVFGDEKIVKGRKLFIQNLNANRIEWI